MLKIKIKYLLCTSLLLNLYSLSVFAQEENNIFISEESKKNEHDILLKFEQDKQVENNLTESYFNLSELTESKADLLGESLSIQGNNIDFFADQELVNESEKLDTKEEEKNWQLEISPYGFLPLNISGDSTINGLTADVNMNLGDVLRHLEFAASGRFEAWHKNKYGIIFDGYYVSLGANGSRTKDNAGFFNSATGTVRGDLRFKQGIFDFGVGYRTEINDPKNYVDVIGGLRLQYLEQTLEVDLEFSNAFIDINRSRRFGDDSTWVEPFLSTRLNYSITKNVSLGGRFDISGFGIEDLSTTWKFLGGIDWWITDRIALNLDYSVFSIDYQKGRGREKLGIDQIQHGPIIGITFTF